jgi:hypothetical protein
VSYVPGANAARREADYSPSSAEVKICKSMHPLTCTSSWPSACLVKHRTALLVYKLIRWHWLYVTVDLLDLNCISGISHRMYGYIATTKL